MKTTISIAGAIAVAIIMSGCATPASQNHVPFRVTSDPSGCPVEVNGVHVGGTPTTIQLGLSKHWVGLFYAPDGWGYGNETYNVTCFPPPDSTEPLTSQTKIIVPSMTPKGADLYFNLRLRPVNAAQPIDLNQRGKSEVIIKDERDKEPDASTYQKMQELRKMKSEGLISDDEYEAKRTKLLNEL